jgi:hypothetical protein
MSVPKPRASFADIQNLLVRQASAFKSWHLSEPLLVFGDGGLSPDPKAGLSAFGPFGTDDDPPLGQLRVGIIGTGETIAAAQHWVTRCRDPVEPKAPQPGDEVVDPILFPAFPGFQAPRGFACRLELPQQLVETLTPLEVARCTRAGKRDAAVEAIVAAVRERLRVLREKPSPPSVVLVALPDEVRVAAGAGRTAPRRARTKPTLQLSLFQTPMEDEVSRTLHRAIKAEGMRAHLPTQLVWPGTFSGEDGGQDDATRAWNFFTALYYKAGGIPWRVHGLPRNTCYIGVSFFQGVRDSGRLQTSMAQAFSDRGDGIVLTGNSFEWDRKTQGSPCLTGQGAHDIIARVLKQYEDHLHAQPSRVVVHKSSPFSAEEMAGMERALGGIAFYDFLSVTRSRIRFMRMGAEPPVRGTVIEVAPKRYVVYTGGYVPFLRVYPGLRIPHPLLITHHRGAGSVTGLVAEVLALTKLNWNCAAFSTTMPITLSFSQRVGLILSELPPDVAAENLYRYYM